MNDKNPCKFTGREVSDRHGKKFPTCDKCGLSKKMYDYLKKLKSDKT